MKKNYDKKRIFFLEKHERIRFNELMINPWLKNILNTSRLLIFAVVTLVLFSLALLETFGGTILPFLLSLIIFIFLIVGAIQEFLLTLANQNNSLNYDLSDMQNFIAVFTGTIITYYLSINLQLGAVMASALVGLFGGLLFKKQAAAIFCGSFAGMASSQVIQVFPGLLLAAIIAAFVFILGKGLFDGFGGKLGTTAFVACVSTAVLTRQTFLSADIPVSYDAFFIVLYSIIAAVITFSISIHLKHGPVVASAAVGLLAGLLLPAMHGATGELFAVAAFCASFAGMCSVHRLRNEASMAVVGLFCGLIFIYSSPWLGGAGGKLGTIAFGSVISLNAMQTVWARLLAYGKNIRSQSHAK